MDNTVPMIEGRKDGKLDRKLAVQLTALAERQTRLSHVLSVEPGERTRWLQRSLTTNTANLRNCFPTEQSVRIYQIQDLENSQRKARRTKNLTRRFRPQRYE